LRRETSRDGHGLRLAVNYLAPYVLAHALAPARGLVNVASAGQEPLDFDDLEMTRGYDGVSAYRRSKLALVMLTFDVAAEGVPANALHPGTFLDTNMVRGAGIAPLGTAGQGAEATTAVIEATLRGVSGTYFDGARARRGRCRRATIPARAAGCASSPRSFFEDDTARSQIRAAVAGATGAKCCTSVMISSR